MSTPPPLPESKFFYRRVFSYVLTVALLGLLGYIIYQLADPGALKSIAFWLIILLWWVATYYMVAPSAEQIARIIQSARMWRRGDDE